MEITVFLDPEETLLEILLLVAGAMMTLFFAVIWLVKKIAMQRQLRHLRGKTACVACGLERIEIGEDFRQCEDCGCRGRRDGGGRLSAFETNSLLPSVPTSFRSEENSPWNN